MSARLSAAADKQNLRSTMYCLAEPQNRGTVKGKLELLGLIRATSVNETNASVVVVQVFFFFFFPLYEVHVQSQRLHYH